MKSNITDRIKRIVLISILVLTCNMPFIASSLCLSNKIDKISVAVNKYSRNTNSSIALMVGSKESTYSSYAYASVGHDLSSVYSANYKNKTFFYSPINSNFNQVFKIQFNESEYSFSSQTIAIQDYGERNIDTLGLKMEFGKIHGTSPDEDDCYLPRNIAEQIVKSLPLDSSEDLIFKDKSDSNVIVKYRDYNLKIRGIISSNSDSFIKELFGDYVVVDRQCMMKQNYGNTKLACIFGRGFYTVKSYITKMKEIHPVEKGYTYEYKYKSNQGVFTISEDNLIENNVFTSLFLSILIYVLFSGALLISMYLIVSKKILFTNRYDFLLLFVLSVISLIIFNLLQLVSFCGKTFFLLTPLSCFLSSSSFLIVNLLTAKVIFKKEIISNQIFYEVSL